MKELETLIAQLETWLSTNGENLTRLESKMARRLIVDAGDLLGELRDRWVDEQIKRTSEEVPA